MYNNGKTVSEICRITNLSYGKVNKFLIKNNIKKVRHYKMSPELYSNILRMLNAGCYVSDISKQLHTIDETVKLVAQENNIKTYNKVSSVRSDKNKNFNDFYFHEINTEEKAYFLGLLYTDGNVREHNGGYFLSIELQKSDEDIVKKLAQELRCGNSLYYRHRKTNYGYFDGVVFTTCNSKQMFDDLARFNIIPNKTKNAKTFTNVIELIPQDLRRHFLRGLIDGDGTIPNFKDNEHEIGIVNPTEDFCIDFDNLLKESMHDDNLYRNIIWKPTSNIFQLRYRRKNDVENICKFLYTDANIYINRKFNSAKRYFD